MEWLIGICILGTVTSQTLLDAGIFLIFFYWLYKRFYKKEKFDYVFGRTFPEKMILGYFAVVCIGYLWPASPDIPVLEYIIKFQWIFHLYLWIWAFSKLEFKPLTWLKFYSFAFLVPNIYALISFARGFDLLTGRDNRRITGLVNSSTYHAHGNVLIFVFFLALTCFYFKKLSQKMQWTLVVALILHFMSIFLTYTRGVWLALAITVFYFMWEYRKKWTLFFGAFLAVGSVLLFNLSGFFHDRIINTLNTGTVDGERWNLFKANVAMFKDHPLLGIGYGDNMRRAREYFDRMGLSEDQLISHAHNQLLNVLATTGLVGFVFFAGFYFFYLIQNARLYSQYKKKSGEYLVLFLGLFWVQLEYVLANLTDVGFEYAKIRALILMCWALLTVMAMRAKRENETN